MNVVNSEIVINVICTIWLNRLHNVLSKAENVPSLHNVLIQTEIVLFRNLEANSYTTLSKWCKVKDE